MRILNLLFIYLCSHLTTLADDYLSMKSFHNTKGWSMVQQAKLDPDNPSHFILKKGIEIMLSNGHKKHRAQYLSTKKLWGDHEIKAEFMVPKGSNSGFYVQGRYELQVLDSFGKKKAGIDDLGGIYQRWDNARKTLKLSPGFEGHAPLVNASRPHGEWQTVTIKFRAPRFDESGYKISHAHFLEVTINGKVVQKGVNVKGPTRAAPLSGEAPTGPLAIQGDHGPILLRKLEIIPRDYSDLKLPKLPEAETFPLDKKNRPQIEKVSLGKKAFSNRGCIECHATFKDKKTIKTGPTLYGLFQKKPIQKTVFDSATKKNVKILADLDYFTSSMGNPAKHLSLQTQAAEKGKPYMPLMPAYTSEMIPENEVSAIHSYLLTLNSAKNAGPATDFASATAKKVSTQLDPHILASSDRTMVVRGMVSNKTSARSIHVGQVNGHNFSFDPRTLAIQSIWSGGFLDMRNEVNGRGGKANTLGAKTKAKAWDKTYTNILQPLSADGKTPYDAALTHTITPDTLSRTVSFLDQLKARNGKLLGYSTSKQNPTFHYQIDGNKVDLTFSIAQDGTCTATLTGKLKPKQNLTLSFPAKAFKDIKTTAGTLDITRGTWTLNSLDKPITWTATPKKTMTHETKSGSTKKASRIQPSPFTWQDQKTKLDITPGYSDQSANGPKYTDGSSPLFEPTAIDFQQDGTPVIGSRAAGIWKINQGQWQPFALGTYEVLGLKIKQNGDLIVCQKPEVSIIKDSDKDGIADHYQTLSADYRFTGNYHAYNHGPAVDSKGNIHFSLNLQHAGGKNIYKSDGKFMGSQGGFRGWNIRLGADGGFSPFAVGLRSAAGLAFSPDDKLYSADNQGEFMGTSRINLIQKGKFYGHPAGLIDLKNMSVKALKEGQQADYIKKRQQSSILMPHKYVANSPGHPVWDTTGGKFGPFQGQMFIGDQTLSNIHRIHLETINGIEQGSIMPFVTGLPSGPMRLSFSPNGEMWVGQTGRGWASRGGKKSALQKFKWNGKLQQAIHHVSAKKGGFIINFNLPITTADRPSYTAAVIESWHYQDASSYGSPEMNKRTETFSAPIWNKKGTAVFYKIKNFGTDPEREKIPNATSRVFRINLEKTAFGKTNSPFLSTAYYTLNEVPKN